MLGKADSSQTCTELKLDSVIFGGLVLLLDKAWPAFLIARYVSICCGRMAVLSSVRPPFAFSHYGGVNTGEFHAVETRLASIDKATFYSTKAIIIAEACQGLGDMGTPGEML